MYIDTSCDLWVHNKCSEITGYLTDNRNFVSHKCSGETVPTVSIKEVNFWNDSFHVESTSNSLVIQLTNVVVVLMQSLNKLPPCEKHSKNCYLSSPIMKPKQNSEGISSTCVRKVLLHGRKTWPVVMYIMDLYWVCCCSSSWWKLYQESLGSVALRNYYMPKILQTFKWLPWRS